MDRDPIPRLVTKRPPRIDWWPEGVTAVHWTTTPSINTMVDAIMAYLRLNTEAKKPAANVPIQAPSSNIEVNHPFWVWSRDDQ